MEGGDGDEIDFNPYLQRSPSLDGEPRESWKRMGKSHEEEEGVVESRDVQEDGMLETEDVHILKGSGELLDDFSADEIFFELASDEYEEEELEDEDCGLFNGLERGKYLSKGIFNRKDRGCIQGSVNVIDNVVRTSEDEDRIDHNNSGDLWKPQTMKYYINSSRTFEGAQDNVKKDSIVPRTKLSAESVRCHHNEGNGEDMMDAISKRTRAQYSLADMSLDQLEVFLQESDEEEYFQNVDDEEEYRKFLLAVQENEDCVDKQRNPGSRKEDDDDEEDLDFEIEVEEALESDDTSQSFPKRKRRRPETRGKRRQRAQLQNTGPLLGQSIAPLRHLLPHVDSLTDDVSVMEKGKTSGKDISGIFRMRRIASVNGFTAHQIGQLYCLIHEHVQLLVQVFSLCILEPARQQTATDTRRMLMELVEQRELVLSWKKTAFPDFCFRPPYTHPSLIEHEGHGPDLRTWTTRDLSTSPSTSRGARMSSNGYFFTQGSFSSGLCDSSTSVSAKYSHSSVAMCSEQEPVQGVSNNGEDHLGLKLVTPEVLPPTMAHTAVLRSIATLYPEGGHTLKLPARLPCEIVKFEWAPVTSGPVRSLLDVAPLALVRDFLVDVSHVVEDYRQRHVESGACHSKFEREPLFVVSPAGEQEENIGPNRWEGTRSHVIGIREVSPTCGSHPPFKKTMAAVLVESIKKQSLALVPKDAAIAVERFLPYFNKSFFPHKPPPIATASRLLFTDAEDELLAMGLMKFNTDWKAIQERFLPSKSMHQIFVRQKNRSSARAPENSIKAVHRMKSSPLTSLEKASIQKGLGMFKYDWNKVWRYCVPHRNPAILPRQWRVAVGTQKSYKTSATSKERRRLYEANRRQQIAAKKASHKDVTMNEDSHPSSPGNNVERRGQKTGNEAVDKPDNSYIREAFLADWCPRFITPIATSLPTVTGADTSRKVISSLSKKRKAKVELGVHVSKKSPWLGSQTVEPICQIRKQTVKLAPGLPSVILPPRVHILSQSNVQSQKPFPLETRRTWLGSNTVVKPDITVSMTGPGNELKLRGSGEQHFEQAGIVMEQEELSDSEDEADAGVQFEHEEMGDSDKETEDELQSGIHYISSKLN